MFPYLGRLVFPYLGRLLWRREDAKSSSFGCFALVEPPFAPEFRKGVCDGFRGHPGLFAEEGVGGETLAACALEGVDDSRETDGGVTESVIPEQRSGYGKKQCLVCFHTSPWSMDAAGTSPKKNPLE